MNKNTYNAPAAYRTMEILELMSRDIKHYNVTEISNELEISTNSVFRILKELQKKGYIEQDSSNASYYLTPKLYYLGNKAGQRISLKKIAEPFMEQLNNETRETVLLAKLNNELKTLLIDQFQSPEPIKFVSNIGEAYPSYSSAFGKVLLAFSSEQTIEKYLSMYELERITENTITAPEELRKHLQMVRENGYAVDEEETCRGLRCMAFPVFDNHNACLASIGISAIAFRLRLDKYNDYLQKIKAAAFSISLKLGSEEEFLKKVFH